MDDLETKTWRRYGHLRIYVSRGAQKVGWYDVRTGRHELDLPELATPFWDAVHTECHNLDEPPPPLPPAPTASPSQEPPTTAEPDVDLRHNQAGAAAQARADELRDWRTWLAAMFGVRTESRNFAVGAKAERTVGAKLDKWARKHGWHVLHAVPVGRNGADIDHVLIGPFGVVTVNTKSTRGKVWVAENGMMVGGTKVDYLRNSRHEAKRARALLTDACGRHVPVHAVVVFVGAKGFTVRNGGPKDVTVLPDVKSFHRWLRRRGRVLTPEQVTNVHTAARRPTTWRT
ncbi:nuclease-related domain-containing protein [Actinomadura napierensis]|uniref:NERD domain-containing protein n=1 Tax=Actinomadura napierensis TaxID=267854 RepID=A0ABN3AHV7_9ACTN